MLTEPKAPAPGLRTGAAGRVVGLSPRSRGAACVTPGGFPPGGLRCLSGVPRTARPWSSCCKRYRASPVRRLRGTWRQSTARLFELLLPDVQCSCRKTQTGHIKEFKSIPGCHAATEARPDRRWGPYVGNGWLTCLSVRCLFSPLESPAQTGQQVTDAAL